MDGHPRQSRDITSATRTSSSIFVKLLLVAQQLRLKFARATTIAGNLTATSRTEIGWAPIDIGWEHGWRILEDQNRGAGIRLAESGGVLVDTRSLVRWVRCSPVWEIVGGELVQPAAGFAQWWEDTGNHQQIGMVKIITPLTTL
jgi:hypothetical protein